MNYFRSKSPSAIAWSIALVGLMLMVTASLADAQEYQSRQFKTLSVEILNGLKNTHLADVSASAGYDAPKVALHNPDLTSSDVSLAEANDINRYLLASLQKQGGSDFHFVDRANLEILAQETNQYGSAADQHRQKDILRENSRADIILVGRFQKTEGEIYVSYQALVTETAQILVSTAPRRVVKIPSLPVSISQSREEISSTTPIPATTGYRATVEQAEIRLEELGYNPGPADGYMTHKTRKAIREYQADSALTVSGRLTRTTFRNMFLDTRIND